jgi:hypothetical protein
MTLIQTTMTAEQGMHIPIPQVEPRTTFPIQNLRIPGPTQVPPAVLAELARPLIDHRGPEFAAILRRITARLQYVFQTTSPVLTFPASGTGGRECAIVNLFSPGEHVVAISIGHFGNRFACIDEAFGDPLPLFWSLRTEGRVHRVVPDGKDDVATPETWVPGVDLSAKERNGRWQILDEKRKKKTRDGFGIPGLLAEPTGTDGLRLRCHQFYTSSNYPHLPFPRNSKKSLQKLLSRLSLRRSDGLAHEIFPMAFQRMNGNSSLHELRTTSPIAQ